jgi:hypothetical protein
MLWKFIRKVLQAAAAARGVPAVEPSTPLAALVHAVAAALPAALADATARVQGTTSRAPDNAQGALRSMAAVTHPALAVPLAVGDVPALVAAGVVLAGQGAARGAGSLLRRARALALAGDGDGGSAAAGAARAALLAALPALAAAATALPALAPEVLACVLALADGLDELDGLDGPDGPAGPRRLYARTVCGAALVALARADAGLRRLHFSSCFLGRVLSACLHGAADSVRCVGGLVGGLAGGADGTICGTGGAGGAGRGTCGPPRPDATAYRSALVAVMPPLAAALASAPVDRGSLRSVRTAGLRGLSLVCALAGAPGTDTRRALRGCVAQLLRPVFSTRRARGSKWAGDTLRACASVLVATVAMRREWVGAGLVVLAAATSGPRPWVRQVLGAVFVVTMGVLVLQAAYFAFVGCKVRVVKWLESSVGAKAAASHAH